MTNPTLAPLISPVSVPPLAEAEAAVREAFGAEFDFWVRDQGDWKMVSPAGRGGPEGWEADALRREASQRLRALPPGEFPPQIDPLGENRHLLILPILREREYSAAAAGVVETAEPGLLRRLALSFRRELSQKESIQRLQDENESFAKQVTDDFEELVFLREMARRLEVIELSRDVLQMAETVLPMLARSIHAETAAILEACGEEGAEAGELVLWHGSKDVSPETCRRLVARFGGAAVDNPVVKNRPPGQPHIPGIPEVRQFILTAMMCGGRIHCWLVAVNRTVNSGYAREGEQRLDALEFGTGEATLLTSVAAMLTTHARNIELFREKENLLTNVVRALVYAIEAKDDYTCGHSERVALYGRAVGRQLQLSEDACEQLYLTGVLHDVGKIGVRDAILKKRGRLSEEEYREIQGHPDGAWSILQELGPLSYVLPGVLYHHERYDGQGYPDGLAGDDIPLGARILAVADAFDAMTSDRSYRTGMPQEKAVKILQEGAGTQWDPKIVDAFLQTLPEIELIRSLYEKRRRAVRIKGTANAQS